METNVSILTREVVALNERKKVGKLKGLRVDCDTLAVNYYILSSASTSSDLVLPFTGSLAVGDTFLTIQSSDELLSTVAPEAERALSEGYQLLNAEVYSRVGNKLGAVNGYEFDPVYGKVLSIQLDSNTSFVADDFIFFSPEFVFVDDGELSAIDLRNAESSPATTPDPVPSSEPEPVVEALEAEPEATTDTAASADSAPAEAADDAAASADDASAAAAAADIPSYIEFDTDYAPAAADSPAEAEDDAEVIVTETVLETEVATEAEAEDAGVIETETVVEPEVATEPDEPETTVDQEIYDLLLGAVLTDDVKSDDGAFTASKGTVLTKEIIDAANQHAALLELTVNIDV